ncbi:MAG: alpha/beta hydrolase [Nanoarchaeota archaeon]|nr:alpha/beta hydrolase [Nanoarchaeota archaeon]
MKHILYIIPGWTESTSQREYQELKKYFSSKGFKVIEISITWKRRVMSQYVEEFLSQCVHSSTDKISILGYSFGAMIAFVSSQQIQYSNMILCSLSPFFKEDLDTIPTKWKNALGKNKLKDFNTISFENIANQFLSSTSLYLFYGEQEPTFLIQRVQKTHTKIKPSHIISISNMKHQLSHPKYIEAIKNNLKINIS